MAEVVYNNLYNLLLLSMYNLSKCESRAPFRSSGMVLVGRGVFTMLVMAGSPSVHCFNTQAGMGSSGHDFVADYFINLMTFSFVILHLFAQNHFLNRIDFLYFMINKVKSYILNLIKEEISELISKLIRTVICRIVRFCGTLEDFIHNFVLLNTNPSWVQSLVTKSHILQIDRYMSDKSYISTIGIKVL